MSKFTVKVKLPAILCDFKASYSHVDKLSGVQYMILTIVSTDSFKELTWGEMMDRLGIPEIIYNEMYKPAIGRMILLKMVEPTGRIDLDDYVGETVLTKMGRQAYEKGVMAQDVDDFSGTVANTPAAPSNKYVKGSTLKACDKTGFIEDRFSDLEPDELKIENHIIKEKSQYGVDEADADVFDIRIERQKDLACYQRDLRVGLDEVTGQFTIESDNLDDNFLKSRFNSPELLSEIPEQISQSSSAEIRYVAWADKVPDWENVRFFLPFDVKFDKSKLVLVNGKNCRSSKYLCSEITGDSDIVVIETSNLGYEYALVEIPTVIEGFEGESKCKLMVRRSIDEKRIAEYIETAARSIDPVDTESLAKALGICDIIADKRLSKEIVGNCLRKTSNFQGTLIELQQYKKAKWYSELPDMVEEAILEKESDAKQVATVLNQANLQIAGTLAASRFKSEDPSIALSHADILAPVVRNDVTFLRDMGLEQTIADMILDGDAPPYSSKHLASMSNLSRNLHELKKVFHIESPSKYTFDLSEMKSEEKERLKPYLSTYGKDMDTIRTLIQGTGSYSELKAYEAFFKEMVQFINPGNGSDLRTYGIEEGIRLSETLEKLGLSGTLDEMISDAHDKHIISDNDHAILTEFRLFRNECAHQMVVGEVKKNKLKQWKQAIDNLSRRENKGEKKE